jgi:ribosomal protein S18 acetylase RimI-like enzyme
MSEIAIRPAEPGDARAIARIDVETWRTTYPGMLSDVYLAGLSPARREPGWAGVIRREPRDVRVAVAADGEVVGFGSCGPCRGEPGFTGEVFTLYVAPDWQNQGIGRRLLLALFSRLAALGRNSAIIWVLRDNPARFFYQRVGGHQVSHRMLPFGGGHVAAQGYGWRDLPNFLASLRADRAREP